MKTFKQFNEGLPLLAKGAMVLGSSGDLVLQV